MADKFNFKSQAEPRLVEWPVTVSEAQDGGEVKTSTFPALFELLTDEQEKAAQPTKADPYLFHRRVFIGLGKAEGVPDDQFPEIFDLCMLRPNVRNAILTAYWQAAQGAPAKN